MNKHVMGLLLGMAAIPLGCTMAPKYARPEAPVAKEWPKGAAYEAAAASGVAQARDLRWQEFFTDEKLRQLIRLALTNNLDLRTAALNVEEARAEYGIQRAAMLPVLSGSADGDRQRIPHDLSNTGKSTISSQYGVNFGVASWEVDFFGRIRSLKNVALQEFLATEQGRRSTQILLISSVADTYLLLAADRESLAIAGTTLQSQEDTYRMVQRRHELGLAPRLDVERAQAQVDAARRDVANFEQLSAQDENALTLLLGRAAPSELLPSALGGDLPARELSAGVSSEVLLARPDVLQAEHELQAAYANIGAARAAFFPRISLTAALGTASSDLSGLFKTGSGTWSYAPQIVVPVFDPRTWSAYKASKVQKEVAVTQYQRAIQGAFRDVVDALAVRGTAGRELSAQQSLVNAEAEAYRLSVARYDQGIDSYLSVLDAQRSLYAAQLQLASLRLAKVSNTVKLYAVLGGGWQPETAGRNTANDKVPPKPGRD